MICNYNNNYFHDDHDELLKYRFEKKYILNEQRLKELQLKIKLNPDFFSEVYQQRYINNIYLDDLSYINYVDNISGQSQRTKYRIRWYGELFDDANSPKLEIKNKKGHLGKKTLFNLISFNIKELLDKNNINLILKKSNIPLPLFEKLLFYRPTLINSYKRRYYLSGNKKVRLTIDENLKYYNVNNFMKFSENKIILEMKYNSNNNESVYNVMNYLDLRINKNSKYINGIKCNNFIMEY